ncbi:MAG: ferritin family protein [Deltaproteobacteria bacterium]|nr:MAG: ferritin family protein [Deltaproteobacteria bacterium]
MFSINEILDMAIRLERNGEAVYRNAIRQISEPQLVSLLKWMADEEVQHAEWFSELKKKLAARPQNPIGEEMSRKLFKDLLGEQSFSLQDTDFSQVYRINDLIAIFIEFEKDTVLFYEMLESFIENEETLRQLKEIIAEENRHIERLKEFLEKEVEATPDNS